MISAKPNDEQRSAKVLVDPFGRRITYVRISVTDRCNLRCSYCMPRDSVQWFDQSSLLTYEEIERFAQAAASLGITKIRITGGEPLVRRDLVKLVERLARVEGIRDLAMTTNGTLLARYARELKAAGLSRLNVSLDTLRADRFREITGSDMFAQVWQGIEAALDAGFAPIKINVVVIKGFNEDELLDFARLTHSYPFHIRFIEYMPIGADREGWERAKVVPWQEIKSLITRYERLEPLPAQGCDSGPERVFSLCDAKGCIGFITPVSDEFCACCNRVRLTSDGKLRGCLMRDGEVDFREPLRSGATLDELRDLLRFAISRKPEKHLINSPDFEYSSFYTMNRLGG